MAERADPAITTAARRWRAAACVLCVGALALGARAPAAAQGEPSWVVDPADPGVNLPPVGRSLFDHLLSLSRDGPSAPELPRTFALLRQRIEAELSRDPQA